MGFTQSQYVVCSLPRPLGFAKRVEVIAVPDVQTKTERGVAPFDDAVQFFIEVFVALEPEAFPDQDFWVGEQDPQEFDERAVLERLARPSLLKILVDLAVGDQHAFDINVALQGFAAGGGTEIYRGVADDQIIEWTAAFVAPHDAVNLVIAGIILENRMQPSAVVRVAGAWLLGVTSELVNFEVLRQVWNLHGVGAAVIGVFEKRFHDFGHDLHASRFGSRNDQIEHIQTLESRVGVAEITDAGVGVKFWTVFDVRPALQIIGLLNAVIGETLELVRDAPPDLQAQPGDRADQQDVDAKTFLQEVEQRFDPLVEKTERADLNTNEFLAHKNRPQNVSSLSSA